MVLVTDTSEGGGVIGGRKLSNDCVGEVGVTTVGLDIIVVTVVWPLTVGVVVPVRFKVSLSPPYTHTEMMRGFVPDVVVVKYDTIWKSSNQNSTHTRYLCLSGYKYMKLEENKNT